MTQKNEHETAAAGTSGVPAPLPTVDPPGTPAHAQADDVNVGMVATIGVFAAVLLFVLIVLLQTWFYNWNDSERAGKIEPPSELQQAIAAQQDKINSYRVLDPSGKVRAIPIERAMEVETAALRADQVAAAHTPPK